MMISRQRSNLTSLIREHNKMASAAAASPSSASASSSGFSVSHSSNSPWNRREKLLGLTNNFDFGFDSGSELLEEDVWGFPEEAALVDDQMKPQSQPQPQLSSQASESGSRLFTSWLSSPAAPAAGKWERRIPKEPIVSAPVNVPDWSKILHKKGGQKKRAFYSEDSDSDEQEKEPEEFIPPHTLAARQDAARISNMVAFSVLEGAGRTLKGRDLSRVRNAVWKQTGYMAAGLV